MTDSILFIDDEPYYARHYVEALQKSGYSVAVYDNAEGGLAHLRANATMLQLVVLDYMMPTPTGVADSDTLDGLATGRWVVRQARELLESLDLRVLILTNRNVDVVQQEIAEFAQLLVRGLITVLHKTETRPSILPMIVGQLTQ